MARELELKLELGAESVGAIRKDALLGGECRTQMQLSVYFDTPDNRVRKAGYSLRVRQTKSGFVQTIKPVAATAGLFDRDEWEAPVSELWPTAVAAAESPLRPLLTESVVRELIPIVRSQVERTVWMVDHGQSKIEVSLDEGTIRGGLNEQRILELELELKDGDAASVIDLARSLSRRVPVRLGVLSKAERGFALAEGTLFRPVQAGPLQLDAGTTVADGFAAIVHACLKHFRLNEPLILADRHPEALRQACLAARRLCSALSIFNRLFEDDCSAVFLDELQGFAARLDRAWNLDVLTEKSGEAHPDRPRLDAARAEAYSAVIGGLETQRFRDVLLELVSWVETGAWRRTSEALRILGPCARRRIENRWKDIETAGARTLEPEPSD